MAARALGTVKRYDAITPLSKVLKSRKVSAGDRGFDSRANQIYMQSHDIFNAVCPRNPRQLRERLEDNV